MLVGGWVGGCGWVGGKCVRVGGWVVVGVGVIDI